MSSSGWEEDDTDGLGLLPGDAPMLRQTPKLPHMGWNSVTWDAEEYAATARARRFCACRIRLAGVFCAFLPLADPRASRMPSPGSIHGGPICVAVCRDALLGVQFHPEKSGAAGVGMLRGWVSAVTVGAESVEAQP